MSTGVGGKLLLLSGAVVALSVGLLWEARAKAQTAGSSPPPPPKKKLASLGEVANWPMLDVDAYNKLAAGSTWSSQQIPTASHMYGTFRSLSAPTKAQQFAQANVLVGLVKDWVQSSLVDSRRVFVAGPINGVTLPTDVFIFALDAPPASLNSTWGANVSWTEIVA